MRKPGTIPVISDRTGIINPTLDQDELSVNLLCWQIWLDSGNVHIHHLVKRAYPQTAAKMKIFFYFDKILFTKYKLVKHYNKLLAALSVVLAFTMKSCCRLLLSISEGLTDNCCSTFWKIFHTEFIKNILSEKSLVLNILKE